LLRVCYPSTDDNWRNIAMSQVSGRGFPIADDE